MPPEVVIEAVVKIHAMTDVGKARSHNEDNFVVCPDLSEKRWYLSDQSVNLSAKGSLLIVADGMGGANAGEVASEIAVETIKERFNAIEIEENTEESHVRDYLYQVMMEAHKAILTASKQNPECAGMGTTIVIAWVFSHKAIIGWCGDSRAYLFRKDGGLKLLSKDHSLVWELVEAGRLTPDEADVHPDNNIITQSLGDKDHSPKPEFISCSLQQADRLLLCSDGLNNMLDHKNIERIIGEETSLADANAKLIELANQHGGSDNITVLSLEVLSKQPEKNSYNALWLFSGIVFSSLLVWLFFFSSFSDSDALLLNKSANNDLHESSTAANKPASREYALTGSVPEAENPHSNENVPEHESVSYGDDKLTYKRYMYLDSLVRLQLFPQRELLYPVNLADSSTSELLYQADLPLQLDEELRLLIRRYRFGLGQKQSSRIFFDSLSETGILKGPKVAEELFRIEELLFEIKSE